MKVLADYPLWLYPIAMVLAAALVYLHYGRGSRNKGFSRMQIRLMASIRFLALCLLILLVFGPWITFNTKRVEQPIIALVTDQSQSVTHQTNQQAVSTYYKELVDRLNNELGSQAELVVYSAGNKFEEGLAKEPNQQETNLDDAFTQLQIRYAGRNLAGVILASDGIYNAGEDPVSIASGMKVPVYTIGLGDSSTVPDLQIKKLSGNKTCFLGNSFPVNIRLESSALKGVLKKLTVKHNDQSIFEEPVKVGSNAWSREINLQVEANAKGVSRIDVFWEPVTSEINQVNNKASLFVEVVERRQKLFIVSEAPHPDIRAIRHSLESSGNWEITHEYFQNITANPADYNAVLVHLGGKGSQLPANLMSRLNQTKAAVLIICGENAPAISLSQLQHHVQANISRGRTQEASPVWNQSFNLFPVSEELLRYTDRLPPLNGPYGNIREATGSAVLFKQRIGNITSDWPQLTFSEHDGRREGVLFGEGIWRWKQQLYFLTGSSSVFDDFILRIMQFLGTKSDRSFFQLYYPVLLKASEPLQMEAQLFDQTYNPLPGKEIKVSFRSEKEGKDFTYLFDDRNGNYYLNAGFLPPGEYVFNAVANTGTTQYRKSGRITISPVNPEFQTTVADFGMLRKMANFSKGLFVKKGEESKVWERIKSRKDLASVAYSSLRVAELIHLKWLFWMAVFLFTVEWVIRKWAGSY